MGTGDWAGRINFRSPVPIHQSLFALYSNASENSRTALGPLRSSPGIEAITILGAIVESLDVEGSQPRAIASTADDVQQIDDGIFHAICVTPVRFVDRDTDFR